MFRNLMLTACAALGVAVLLVAEYHRRLAMASRHWPVVSARVVETAVEVHHDVEGGTWYEPIVRYEYRVAGRLYTGTGISFASEAVYSLAEGEARVAQYPVGTDVHVHVHPHRPDLAVLEVKEATVGFVYFFGFAVLAVPAWVLLWS